MSCSMIFCSNSFLNPFYGKFSFHCYFIVDIHYLKITTIYIYIYEINALPSMLWSLTRESPIGQGRCGDLVENTPHLWPARRGGDTFAWTEFPSVIWK